MIPIWEYTRKMRINTKTKNQPLNQQNGELATSATQILETWTRWIQEKFHTKQKDEKLAQHIKEEQWEEWNKEDAQNAKQIQENYNETKINNDIKNIRKNLQIATIFPQISIH